MTGGEHGQRWQLPLRQPRAYAAVGSRIWVFQGGVSVLTDGSPAARDAWTRRCDDVGRLRQSLPVKATTNDARTVPCPRPPTAVSGHPTVTTPKQTRRCSVTSTRSPPGHRALFDRLHRLILQVRPDAAVVLASYQIPALQGGPPPSVPRRVEARRVGLWLAQQGRDPAGFTLPPPRGSRPARAPSSCGPLRTRSRIPDDEFRDLIRAALEP